MTAKTRVAFALSFLCLFLPAISGCGDGRDAPTTAGPPPDDRAATPVETELPDGPGETVAGDKTVKAERCTIEGKEFVGENNMSMLQAVEVVGDKLMVLDGEGKIHGFTVGGDGLTLTVDPSFGDQGVLELEHSVDCLSRDGTGRLFASSRMYGDTSVIRNGNVEFTCKTGGGVAMHTSGEWGIAYSQSSMHLVTFAENACIAEEFKLPDTAPAREGEYLFTGVKFAAVIGDQILIGGRTPAKGKNKEADVVVAFNKAAAEQFRFGNTTDDFADDTFAWIHGIDSCATGICVLDSNFRQLTLWTNDGNFVSMLKLNDLFDLGYPWIPGFTVADDGTAYFLATQDRDDGDIADGYVYRVTGL